MDTAKVVEQVLYIKRFLDNQKSKILKFMEAPLSSRTRERHVQEIAELNTLINITTDIIKNVEAAAKQDLYRNIGGAVRTIMTLTS